MSFGTKCSNKRQQMLERTAAQSVDSLPSTLMSWMANRRIIVQIIPSVIFRLPSTISNRWLMSVSVSKQLTLVSFNNNNDVIYNQAKFSTDPIGFFTVRRYALHGICYSNSVCPSVRLSVTLVDCVHMVRPTIMISSPQSSPIILVSGDITFIPKFEGGHPERGRWMRVGWVRIGDVRPISRRISDWIGLSRV